MHVLMLLARADPAAARALCGALRQGIADDRIWVYYQMAPLVPILRQADLRKARCPMRLPAARLRTSVPGQESWVAAGLLLERFLEEGSSKPSSIETVDLLRALSADDFSLLRRSPPLIYHNDLTASVKRFYWSEEFGYALWLRIYLENARKR